MSIVTGNIKETGKGFVLRTKLQYNLMKKLEFFERYVFKFEFKSGI